MNTSQCACRTAALRIFVRSLIAPQAPQWRRFNRLGDRRYGSTSVLSSGFRPIRRQTIATLPAGRQMHATPVRSEEKKAVDGIEQTKPLKLLTDTTLTMETFESERARPETASPEPENIEVAGEAQGTDVVEPAEAQETQTPGKNKKKKLRRQQEAEAARAAANAEYAAAKAAAKKPKLRRHESKKLQKQEPIQEEETEGVEAKEVEAKGAEAEGTAMSATAATLGEATADAAITDEVATDAPTEQPETEERVPKGRRVREQEKQERREKYEQQKQQKRAERPPPKLQPWMIQKEALKAKFPEGWQPRKKLSPDAIEGIRALRRQFPETYTTPVLAKHFEVSAEAIRRILRSKWQPRPGAEEEDRQTRWFNRGKQVWTRWAELGRKPPKRWQAEGIRRDPSWAGRRQRQLEWREELAWKEQLEKTDKVANEEYEAFFQEGGGRGERPEEDEVDRKRATAAAAVETAKAAEVANMAHEAEAEALDVAGAIAGRRGRSMSQGRWTRLQRHELEEHEQEEHPQEEHQRGA